MKTIEQQRRSDWVQGLYRDAARAGLTVPDLLRRRKRRRIAGLFAGAGIAAGIAHGFGVDLPSLFPLWLPTIAVTTTDTILYGTWTSMTVTNLQSLANDSSDPYAGWQSARVDNQTSVLADDYEIQILLSTAATSPANDQAIYVYLVPWIYDGSAWTPAANFGTTTRPTGSEATASISDPNSMKGPFVIPYKVTSQPLDGWFTVGQMCGGIVPDGWSLALRNCTGAALGTGCVVAYRSIKYQNS